MLEVIGSGKVELFDARSLRKVEEVPFRNILLRGGTEWAKWHARRDYSYPQTQAYFGGDTFQYARNAGYDARPVNCFNNIGLTADARVPALDEDGQVSTNIAYANKANYSGSDVKRGTPNYAECEQTTSHTRWVFDWPTSAGNGTFRSIWWYNSDESTDWPMYVQVDASRSANWPVSGNGMYSGTYDAATGKVWGTGFDGSGRVGLGDWGSGAGTISFAEIFRYPTLLMGAAVVGSEVFFCDYSIGGRIYVFSKGTNSPGVNATPLRTLNLPSYPSSSGGTLATDGTNLFYSNQTTGLITKFTPAGTVLGTFTLTTLSGSGAAYGIIYDPSNDDLVIHQNSAMHGRYGAGGATFGQLKSYFRGSSAGWGGFAVGGRLWNIVPQNQFYRLGLTPSSMGARTRLPADVTKSNLQTMKITYQFDYV